MASVIIPDDIIPEELTPEMIAAIKATLPDTDEEPLDTPWDRDQINMLVDIVKQHYRGRTDFYAGGNMFIYFPKPQVDTMEYKGPDFFLVRGVDGTIERRFWWVLDEHNRYPDLIHRIAFPSTARFDRTTRPAGRQRTPTRRQRTPTRPGTRSRSGPLEKITRTPRIFSLTRPSRKPVGRIGNPSYNFSAS